MGLAGPVRPITIATVLKYTKLEKNFFFSVRLFFRAVRFTLLPFIAKERERERLLQLPECDADSRARIRIVVWIGLLLPSIFAN